ncbi:MAG: DUF6471 domain-containing protein [Pseudomonadota bacterium]
MAKLFDSPQMRETLRRYLRGRMAYKGYEYKDLSQALDALGVQQSESNLRSKINNGSLGAQLYIYILLALDVKQLDLQHLQEILADVEENQPQAPVED